MALQLTDKEEAVIYELLKHLEADFTDPQRHYAHLCSERGMNEDEIKTFLEKLGL